MPIFRDNSSAHRTAENGLLSREHGRCPGFSLQGTCAVQFQEGHKANAMRSEAPGFGDSELIFIGVLGKRFRCFPLARLWTQGVYCCDGYASRQPGEDLDRRSRTGERRSYRAEWMCGKEGELADH